MALSVGLLLQPASAESGGVVVDSIREGFSLAKADLRPGDLLLAWERMPDPPANPRGATGEISSVFDWMWLVLEQAPRGTVRLTGRRGEARRVFTVAPGLWEGEVRPRMPEELLSDYRRGRQLLEAGEIVAATARWEQLAAAAGDWRLRCWISWRLGELWSDRANRERAEAAYRAGLAESREPFPKSIFWRAIGDLHARQGNELELARQAYDSAREIREAAWGSESLALAESLDDLATMAWYGGDLEQATRLLERPWEIIRKLAPESLDAAMNLNNRGFAAWRRGDLDRAMDFHRRALEIRQRWTPDTLNVAHSLDNLGDVAFERRDLERAMDFHGRALEIRHALVPDGLAVARSLTSLGSVALERGDPERARDFLQRAVDIQERQLPGSVELAHSLSHLAGVTSERGDPERAARLYLRALEILLRQAADSLDIAFPVKKQDPVDAPDHQPLASRDPFQVALEEVERADPKNPDVATILFHLGKIAGKQERLGQAEALLREAVRIRQASAPESVALAQAFHALGELHLRTVPPQKTVAGDFFRRALETLDSQLLGLGGSHDVRAGFRAEYHGFYHDALEVELELGRPEAAFHTLERSRARSFLEQLAERDAVFTADVPEALDRERRRLATRFDRAQGRLATLDARNHPDEVEEVVRELRRMRDEARDIEEKIRRGSPRLAALRYPRPLDFEAARSVLDPGTLMLSYSVGGEGTRLFVVSDDRPLEVHSVPVDGGRLRQHVEEFHRQTHYPSWPRRAGSRARKARFLYQKLIEPAEEAIRQNDRLLIIPDGPLHLLPFAALVREVEGDEGRPWQYLVEWKALHSVLSATVYAEHQGSRRQAGARSPDIVTAFGDPGYSREVRDVYVAAATERGFDFSPLPYTRQEVQGIARLYPQAKTYLGADATEERAKAVGKDTRILHFATHGQLDDRLPLNSFVALTLPEPLAQDRDNGLLQVWEIFERVRLDADLVVLSACESALGEELSGEGLIGLTRAFQYAGARSVAATLWKVADQTTAVLMERFYRHLRAGRPKDEALRAAQLELIRGPIDVTNEAGQIESRDASAPYYWAAFQIYGDWR